MRSKSARTQYLGNAMDLMPVSLLWNLCNIFNQGRSTRFLGEGEFYSTIMPSARKVPISTLTRCPGFTYLPLFEKAIQ